MKKIISMSEKDAERLEHFHISATGSLEKFSEREKQRVSDLLTSFMAQYAGKFEEAHLRMNVKEHKETFRDLPLIHCSMNLVTDKGRFNTSEHGWGFEQAVNNNIENLEFQISKRFGKMENNASVRKIPVEDVIEAEA